ncbi:ComEA family DNA-binding protein [Paenibacillus sp. 598K]|uniref:ComEA family DNA-binding protein n=1 Tax=Paenibacillus sp. 598K TaxID=1117987 RepID=UPI0021A9BB86|nr:helix-hairpin-helix domain-containing protein [Paenibacillus sp. 598K]
MKSLHKKEKQIAVLLLAAGALLLILALTAPQEDDSPVWLKLDNGLPATSLAPTTADTSAVTPSVVDPSAVGSSGGERSIESSASTNPQPTQPSDTVQSAGSVDPSEPAGVSDTMQGQGTVEPAGQPAAGTTEPPATPDSAAASGLIDINRASAEQLDSLPGIGPAKAQAIIADREQHGIFRSVDELTRVRGIGDKMLEKLRPYATALP